MIEEPDNLSHKSTAVVDFSLFAGGPLFRIALRMGLVRNERTLPFLGVALAILLWIPLLLLVAIHQFRFGGVASSFLLSLGTHARFLIATPLFFIAEAWIGPRLRSLVRSIVESNLVLSEEVDVLNAAIHGLIRSRDSVFAEAALVALTIATMLTGVRGDVAGNISAWRTAGGMLTQAGWWYGTVSLPIFQFLCWRWCWRELIWTVFLGRLARLNLQLVPTHPDLCGGLGYLGIAQSYFGTLGFAVSATLAGSIAEQIFATHASTVAFLPSVAGIAFINLLVFLGPLMFFTPRLVEVQRKGLREYGVLASAYTRLFDAKWVHSTGPFPNMQDVLGTSDIQSLADLSNSYQVVRNMRWLAFSPAIILGLTAAAVAPMLPLLLFEFSLHDLLSKLVRLLVGV